MTTEHPEYKLGICRGEICENCDNCKYCFRYCKQNMITKKQQDWLISNDYEEKDVMYDEYDDAYVIDIDEEGKKRRVYLHLIK